MSMTPRTPAWKLPSVGDDQDPQRLSPKLSLPAPKIGLPEPTAANLLNRGSDCDGGICEEKWIDSLARQRKSRKSGAEYQQRLRHAKPHQQNQPGQRDAGRWQIRDRASSQDHHRTPLAAVVAPAANARSCKLSL